MPRWRAGALGELAVSWGAGLCGSCAERPGEGRLGRSVWRSVAPGWCFRSWPSTRSWGVLKSGCSLRAGSAFLMASIALEQEIWLRGRQGRHPARTSREGGRPGLEALLEPSAGSLGPGGERRGPDKGSGTEGPASCRGDVPVQAALPREPLCPHVLLGERWPWAGRRGAAPARLGGVYWFASARAEVGALNVL